MEWSYYAEIYETVEAQPAEAPAVELKWEDRKLAGRFDPATSGLVVLDADGDGRPDLLAWSAEGVVLLRNGETAVAHSGLETLKGVIAIVPGDFDNDGLPDLCVLYELRRGALSQSEGNVCTAFRGVAARTLR